MPEEKMNRTTTLIFAILLSVSNLYIRSLVIAQLWNWYLVDLGMSEIEVSQAFGLYILFSAFQFAPDQVKQANDQVKQAKDKVDLDRLIEEQFAVTPMYVFLWCLGYIFHT